MKKTKRSRSTPNREAAALFAAVELVAAELRFIDSALCAMEATTAPSAGRRKTGARHSAPLASRGGAVVARGLKRVAHALSMLELLVRHESDLRSSRDAELKRWVRDLPARLEVLRRDADASGVRFQQLVDAGMIDPNLPPTPAPPDPLCMWFCELINKLRCRHNPDCTIIPCSLYC